MAAETIGRAAAPPGATEAAARALVASAWAWLRDGERWAQGRATIPDAGAEGGVRACSIGALSMAGAAGTASGSLDAAARRLAFRALARGYDPDAACLPDRPHRLEADGLCDVCANVAVARGNDGAAGWSDANAAFARALAALDGGAPAEAGGADGERREGPRPASGQAGRRIPRRGGGAASRRPGPGAGKKEAPGGDPAAGLRALRHGQAVSPVLAPVRFNPRPAVRPSAAGGAGSHLRADRDEFQSSPGREAGSCGAA